MSDQDRFKKLPDAPSPDELVATHDVDAAPDDGGGPWQDIEWMLKNVSG
jgi:hypothetical protein